MKIIALKGKGSSGKTTTINLLPTILIKNGYKVIPNKHQNHGSDFLDIYEKNSFKVGITSSGDSFDLVNDRLTDLVNEKCDVCICACRTADRKPPGTIAATQNFSNYKNCYLSKSYAQNKAQENQCNHNDAMAIYKKI